MTEWVCGNCRSINRGGARTCYSCGGAMDAVAMRPDVAAARLAEPTQTASVPVSVAMPIADPVASVGGGAAAMELSTLGGAAASGPTSLTDEAEMPEPTPAEPARPAHVVRGVIGGLVAAIVASAAWYGVVAVTQWQVGLVAIAVGWLVGTGVVVGSGGRASFVLIPVSVVLTFLALAISEYLIVVHFIGRELGASIDVIQPLDLVAELVVASLQADPVTLVFWAIALFEAVVIPARAWRAGPATD